MHAEPMKSKRIRCLRSRLNEASRGMRTPSRSTQITPARFQYIARRTDGSDLVWWAQVLVGPSWECVFGWCRPRSSKLGRRRRKYRISKGFRKLSQRHDSAASIDPELSAVIDTWDRLPEAVRAGIVAMVKAAAKGGGR